MPRLLRSKVPPKRMPSFFLRAETPAHGAVESTQRAAALNRCMPTLATEIVSGLFPGRFGHQIDGPADGVGILAGGKSFVDFDAFNQVRGNRVQLDVADNALGGRNVHAIDSDVGEARFGAANLDVLAFTFVALERDAGQAANGISDVGVRQTLNHPQGQHLDDFVGHALDVDASASPCTRSAVTITWSVWEATFREVSRLAVCPATTLTVI